MSDRVIFRIAKDVADRLGDAYEDVRSIGAKFISELTVTELAELARERPEEEQGEDFMNTVYSE